MLARVGVDFVRMFAMSLGFAPRLLGCLRAFLCLGGLLARGRGLLVSDGRLLVGDDAASLRLLAVLGCDYALVLFALLCLAPAREEECDEDGQDDYCDYDDQCGVHSDFLSRGEDFLSASGGYPVPRNPCEPGDGRYRSAPMDWKKALKMVVGIPETAKGAAKLGSVPAGTEEALELPAGELKISYAENTNPPTEDERMLFFAPEGFEVSVTDSDGQALEVREPGGVMVGKSPGPVAWREIGHVTVPAAGTYRVSSTPAPADRNEPRLLLAPK